jgi:hypothetical protein
MIKVKRFSLSTPCRHTGRVEVYLQSFLTLALDEGEWFTSHPGKNYNTH